jgi:hypothetical protein
MLMAARRMFSLKIIDTDAFLEMPVTSQCLYFHLSLRADDDGFVASPRKILKMIGSNEDDLKILVAKKFIIPFDSGICVIKHWRIHNYIQSDRYHATIYKDELNQLDTSENGSYDIKCIQNVSRMDTEVRLGKVKEKDIHHLERNDGKSEELLKIEKQKEEEASAFAQFWEAYPRKVGKAPALKKWTKCKLSKHLVWILDDLKFRCETVQPNGWVDRKTNKLNGSYIPHPITYLNQERWEDEVFEDE